LKLADRLLVIYQGRIQAELDPERATLDEIGLHMMGAAQGEGAAA
jgi:ABC-type uncharacterized transport system ATPase subunit